MWKNVFNSGLKWEPQSTLCPGGPGPIPGLHRDKAIQANQSTVAGRAQMLADEGYRWLRMDLSLYTCGYGYTGRPGPGGGLYQAVTIQSTEELT